MSTAGVGTILVTGAAGQLGGVKNTFAKRRRIPALAFLTTILANVVWANDSTERSRGTSSQNNIVDKTQI